MKLMANRLPVGRRSRCFFAGSTDPAGNDCGMVLRSLGVVGRVAVPVAEVQPGDGADCASVVAPGVLSTVRNVTDLWRITRQTVCAGGVDPRERVIFLEDG